MFDTPYVTQRSEMGSTRSKRSNYKKVRKSSETYPKLISHQNDNSK